MNGVLLILAIVAIVALVVVATQRGGARNQQTQLADARADAQRWYERLGGQMMNLHADEPAARQALADAGERYNAAGGQLQQATSVRQFELARESALEGLAYVRAARVAMGLDPGPDLPPLAASRGTGQLTQEREVSVQGHAYRAGPQPGPETPYYYPGGRVQGRPVPAGWYSTPVWKTALGTGAGVLGGMLIFDALFSPSFGDVGYADGYQDGLLAGNDFGDANGLGDLGGNDIGGDFGGGDWGGGDFGGGDFGGGGDF
ncbi:hypothetical protein ACWT_7567 [Actinoplanes sp. SE50]|uniref:hypothetical protein n=1 Tax=unclassified Actinoplanes TaxID=2626549 RepID=UPI00023EDD2F|nr:MULTISPECIES: hypothetical protein [unclassified Actinoplanes]AEV88577.1 hypothetical protein ACPL_7697 [Actinoplanes sp. SE50/110]ATO86982.1 hypothetical protein ACWT_7567 [Actinoplanes sp. SE50]SLM04400.1 uncharacterized protein ACSP50_7705 [Actinoplanes sp. SE50/110]